MDLNAIADVRHEQDGRPAVINRQRLGVAFCLQLRGVHRLHPTGRTAPGRSTLDARGGLLTEDVEIVLALAGSSAVSLAPLLGFQDEAIALLAIDPTEALRAVAVVLNDAAFEHIGVVGIIGSATIWRRNLDQRAEAVDEALCIGKL